MRLDVGRTDVPSAGSAVAINDVALSITWVALKNPPTNANNVFVGNSDVSSTNGWTLQPNEFIELDFDPQGKGTSILASELFADVATSGHDVEWIMIFK